MGGPKTGRQGVVWAERWRTLRALTISGIELTLEAARSGVLPPYQGALPRSVLGAALRKAFCSFLDRQCEDCALEADCVSWQVFCTPLPNGLGLGGSFAPHLFVISPGGYGKSQYERGDRLTLLLTLVGRAIGLAPYFRPCGWHARRGWARGGRTAGRHAMGSARQVGGGQALIFPPGERNHVGRRAWRTRNRGGGGAACAAAGWGTGSRGQINRLRVRTDGAAGGGGRG